MQQVLAVLEKYRDEIREQGTAATAKSRIPGLGDVRLATIDEAIRRVEQVIPFEERRVREPSTSSEGLDILLSALMDAQTARVELCCVDDDLNNAVLAFRTISPMKTQCVRTTSSVARRPRELEIAGLLTSIRSLPSMQRDRLKINVERQADPSRFESDAAKWNAWFASMSYIAATDDGLKRLLSAMGWVKGFDDVIEPAFQ